MLEAHPAAELFPMLPDDELRPLAADIAANGLREPIVLFDGRILDGRNRYAACQLVGVTPDTVEWAGECGSPVAFVISANVRRRHLTVGELALIAVQAEKLSQAAPNLEQRKSAGRSLDKHAKAVGISKSSAHAFKRISKDRPDLAAKVVAGELTINAATKVAFGERAYAGADAANGKPRLIKLAAMSDRRELFLQCFDLRAVWFAIYSAEGEPLDWIAEALGLSFDEVLELRGRLTNPPLPHNPSRPQHEREEIEYWVRRTIADVWEMGAAVAHFAGLGRQTVERLRFVSDQLRPAPERSFTAESLAVADACSIALGIRTTEGE